jgi:hypothetical protein
VCLVLLQLASGKVSTDSLDIKLLRCILQYSRTLVAVADLPIQSSPCEDIARETSPITLRTLCEGIRNNIHYGIAH